MSWSMIITENVSVSIYSFAEVVVLQLKILPVRCRFSLINCLNRAELEIRRNLVCRRFFILYYFKGRILTKRLQ